jgi:hypothetical protein
MESEPVFGVSVLTPCRNNPVELAETLTSIGQQVSATEAWNEVFVIDGSDGPACREQAERMAVGLVERRWRLHWLAREARGIYDALNTGLKCSQGRWIQIMPASDRYWDAHSLQRLVRHARRLGEHGVGAPAAVFGQAWVEVPGRQLGWLTPDPRVGAIESWLRWMVPCHQAMLFEGAWARAHPYPDGSPVYGDRPVMRAALAGGSRQAYLAEPVCIFRLGGLSSGLPEGQELQRRLRDPCLDGPARQREWIKAALGRVAPAGVYPHLMRLRAAWLGWRC